MKTLILGDIHGRVCWKDIMDKENPDLTIFLGDYVTTHEDINSHIQLNNCNEILEYKENNPDKVILLRGNHDLQCLYDNRGAWSCYPEPAFDLLHVFSSQEYRDRFLKLTQWIYIQDDTIYSHAGISQTWLRDTGKSVNKINDLEPDESLFGFRPDSMFDMSGDSKTQGCIWIRPQSLVEDAIPGYTQVIGHSTVHSITDIKKLVPSLKNSIWLCDNLPDEYLIRKDDGTFEVKENYTS